jgi:hypothetical protein
MAETDDIADILGERTQDIEALEKQVQERQEPEPRQEPAEDLALSTEGERAQPEQQDDAHDRTDAAMVPSGRLREANERARAAEQRAEAEQRRMDELEHRQRMFQELYEGQMKARQEELAPKEEAPPDPEQDVVGYIKYMEKQRAQDREQIQELRQGREQTQQLTERQQLVQDLRSRAQADAQEFIKEAPDFHEAYQYMRESRLAELQAVGVSLQNAIAHVDNEELQLNAHSVRSKRNIAGSFYAMAKARGWQGKAPAQSQNVHQLRPEQQAQSPAFQQAPPPAHRQTMANMEAGMRQSRSLDEAASGGTATPPTLETLANWSEADVAANYEKYKQMMRRSIA